MRLFSRGRQLLAVTALSINLLALPALAHGNHTDSSDQNLGLYAPDTAATLTVKLDAMMWLKRVEKVMKGSKHHDDSKAEVKEDSSAEVSPDEEQTDADADEEMNDEDNEDTDTSNDGEMDFVKEMGSEIKKHYGFDWFWDGLLNLGDSLTMGYRPYPGRAGDVMLALSVKDGSKVQHLINQLYLEARKEGKTTETAKEAFGAYQIYSFEITDEPEEGFEAYRSLHVAVTDKQVLATLGPDNTQLKNMLYRREVLPENARNKLSNVAYFKPVKDHLQAAPIWGYLDTNSLVQVLEFIRDDEMKSQDTESDSDAVAELDQSIGMLKPMIPAFRGMGFSADVDDPGVIFRSFVSPDRSALNAEMRQYMAKLYGTPEHPIQPVLDDIPGHPLLVYAGQHLDLSFDNPFMHSIMDLSKDSGFDWREISEGFQKFTQLNPAQDLQPYLDGRYGVLAFDNTSAQPEKGLGSIMAIGIKEGQGEAFEQNLVQKFKIDLPNLVGDWVEAKLDALRFEKGEMYKGIQLYNLAGMPDLEDLEDIKAWVQPVLARKDHLLLLAQNPQSMRAYLDGKQTQGNDFQQLVKSNHSMEAANYFFLNVTQSLQVLSKVMPDDEDIQDLVKELQAWKGLYATSTMYPDGIEGLFMINLDWDKVDFSDAGKLLDMVD